jgi:Ca2+-transporting ATPase
MIYKTTTVVAGRGRAIVVATGMATEVGRIGALAAGVSHGPTPLERRLDVLGRRLAGAAILVAAVVIGIGIAQGLPLGALLQSAIALAVAAVPEGLPVVGTIAMAVGVHRMARRRALVRHLPVVETLGSATVICTDKTGTLTAGEMTATVVRLSEAEVAIPDAPFTPGPELALALRVGALANRAHLMPVGPHWQGRGDPTEVALLAAARKAGMAQAQLREECPEVAEVPFSSERMLMATFHRAPQGLLACVKGAPRRIVALSTRLLTADGVRELDEAERERLLRLNRDLAARGLRVLGLAMKEVGGTAEADLQGLTWVGFVGMIDPPAPGVRETVRSFREAGIRTVMLTGDQQLTAETVARELGLLGPGESALDGRELDRLSDEALRDAVGRTAAFSRVSPEAKLRIVAAYQARGEIVAMLGDGVNDAAALRKADIGVAMGGRGTDLAKEAADLILEDDRLPTIAMAIEHGRVIFDNIRKFVFYLFSCNLAEILVLLGAALAGLPAPLNPLQILWLNLLTDTFPALALAVEPGEPAVMRQPPRDPRAALLPGSMVRATVGFAALIAASSLAAFLLSGSTAAFMTLAFAQIFHLGNARSAGPVLVPERALANRLAIGAVILAVALQLSTILLPPLARILGVTSLAPADWGMIGLLGLTPAVIGQAIKWAAAGQSRAR